MKYEVGHCYPHRTYTLQKDANKRLYLFYPSERGGGSMKYVWEI